MCISATRCLLVQVLAHKSLYIPWSSVVSVLQLRSVTVCITDVHEGTFFRQTPIPLHNGRLSSATSYEGYLGFNFDLKTEPVFVVFLFFFGANMALVFDIAVFNKGKGHHMTCLWRRRYSSNPFANWPLERGEMISTTLWPSYPRERPSPSCTGG